MKTKQNEIQNLTEKGTETNTNKLSKTITQAKQKAIVCATSLVLTLTTIDGYCANDYLAQGMGIISKGLIAFGSVWTVWGIIGLAGGINDNNGHEIKQGILKAVGGVLISVAAVWLAKIDFNFA